MERKSARTPSTARTLVPAERWKILHVLGGSLFGGATRMVIAICSDFAERGCEVHVLASDPTTAERFSSVGVTVHTQPRIPTPISPFADPIAVREVSRLCRREGYTVVHTHTSKAGFVGRLSAHRAKVPHVLHTVHGFAFHESSSAPAIRFYGALERRAARWCERLIFVNEFHRRWALQMRIASTAKAVLIPNGLPHLPAGSHEKAVHRSELGIPADAEVIGVIGRLAPDKRVEDLLEVMPQLVAEFPSAVLLLVGDGPSSDSVRDAVRRLGLGDHVVTTGFVEDVERYYEIVDVVVLPTVREGLSISLLEAMRAGRAIVTTSIGSNLTVVEADRSALLVPPASPAALLATIPRVLRDPQLATSLGDRAREAFESNFTQDLMLERTRALYSGLLGDQAVGGTSAHAIGST